MICIVITDIFKNKLSQEPLSTQQKWTQQKVFHEPSASEVIFIQRCNTQLMTSTFKPSVWSAFLSNIDHVCGLHHFPFTMGQMVPNTWKLVN